MKRSVVIMGAVASSMLAGAVPARSDTAGGPQIEATSAADLRPISPAAREQILDLPRVAESQFIQGGFSETGPDPKHFSESHFHENPHLQLKHIKKKNDTPQEGFNETGPDPKHFQRSFNQTHQPELKRKDKQGLLLPATDVAAAYLAFRKMDSA